MEEQYVSAIRKGDVKSLEQMLSDEVQVLADGGNLLRSVTFRNLELSYKKIKNEQINFNFRKHFIV